MSTTPRTHDDGRNERQRQADRDLRQRELDEERERQGGDVARADVLEARPHDFIERTKPEDRISDRFGQLTRDNVTPAIPSAEPGTGGIVDPRSLGMESQAGVPPPAVPEQQDENVVPGLVPGARMGSINEPFGSNIATGDAGPVELPPLELTDISPDTAVAGSQEDLVLTVTGAGFTPNCVILFDDEEMGTTVVNSTTLTASVPVASEPGIVDVEVGRGEDLSDVLTFEFVAPAGTRSSQKAQRKPKKAEPSHKRTKKDKGKGKR